MCVSSLDPWWPQEGCLSNRQPRTILRPAEHPQCVSKKKVLNYCASFSTTKYCQKAILTVYGDTVWLNTVFTALCPPLPLKCWFLTLMNASNQTPLVVSTVCFHRNKAILFYFNMLKCANPAVLINLQCPTTQVRGQVMPTYFHSVLCSSPTFPPWLIMHDWWALSLRGRVASCSSVSPSALTDLQLFLMHGIPKTGNISSSSASRASRLAVRWERGLFCIFANQLKIHLLNAKLCLTTPGPSSFGGKLFNQIFCINRCTRPFTHPSFDFKGCNNSNLIWVRSQRQAEVS